MRPYAGLLGLAAAVAAVAVMSILPSRETILFRSSPLSVASAPAISTNVQAAEQPSTAGVSLPVMLMVRN